MHSLILSATLIGVSVLAGPDFFIHNVNVHRNMSVNPCDNFFRHACTREVPLSERFIPRTQQLMREQMFRGEQINQQKRNWTHFEVLLRTFTLNPNLLPEVERMAFADPDWNKLHGYQAIRMFKGLRERMNYLEVADRDLTERSDLMRQLYEYARTEFEQSTDLYTPEQIKFFLNVVDRLRYDVSSDMPADHYAAVFDNLGAFFDEVKVLQEFTPENIKEKLSEFVTVLTTYGRAINSLSPLAARVRSIDSVLEFGALYAPLLNHVYISDTIFQLSRNITSASLLGSVGAIMGHEFYHAFQRSKYWKIDHLGESALCIQNHMTNICKGYKEIFCASGPDTYEEDGADVEGVQLAYEMLKQTLGDNITAKVDGTDVTHQQLFFYTYANLYCVPEEEIDHKKFDEHSASYVRINGPLSLMDAFHDAFQCKTGDKMKDIAQGTEQCNTFGTPVRK